MRDYKFLILVMLLSIVLMLSGCKAIVEKLSFKKTEDVSNANYLIEDENFIDVEKGGLRKTVLYYKDDKGLVIPVMRQIPWEEAIGRSAINQLIDTPVIRDELAKIGLMPVLPSGTEVTDMSINEGLCKVDFNKDFLSYHDEKDEKVILQSLVYTLTEFPAISKVQITVEGQTLKKLTYGSKIGGPLERKNINLAQDLSDETIPMVVYYKSTSNGKDSFYIPVTKAVNALKGDIKSALVALLEGAPENTGLYSEIPVGTSINDVYVKNGVAYIDFSEEVKKVSESTQHQQSLIYELGLTLREIESSVSQVRILSNGTEIQLSSDVSLNLPDFSNEF